MLVGFFAGSLVILTTWLILVVIFVGIGFTIQRGFGLTTVDATHYLMSFWMGFSFVLFFLQVWHLAFAITWHALAVVVVLGVGGLLWNGTKLCGGLFSVRLGKSIPYLITVLFVGIWIANRAMGPSNTWDDGLYHIPSVRWVEQHRIIPGLGNLLSWLAVNNSGHLYYATLDAVPWSISTNHLSNGLLVFVLILQIILSAFRFVQDREHQKGGSFVFDLALLAAVSSIILSPHVSSLMTDISTVIVLLAATSAIFRSFENISENEIDEAYHLVFGTTLFVVAVCLKLSALVFSAILYVLALTIWLLRNRTKRMLITKTFSWVFIITLSLGLTWLARGVILSGYPAFPSTMLAFPVEWRMPTEQVEAELTMIKHVNHWYYDLHSRGLGWEWLPGWLANLFIWRGNLEQVVLPTGLTILMGCWYLGHRRSTRSDSAISREGWLLLLPATVGIGVWFFTSAGLRYGWYLFWILAATTLAQTLPLFFQFALREARVKAFVILLLIGTAPISVLVFSTLITYKYNPVAFVLKQLFIVPDPERWFHVTPAADLKTDITRSGLTLWVPVHDNRCWNAPLPCTPYPAPNLRLRRDGNLDSGFMVDGSWQPTNWPGPNFKWVLPHWREHGLIK